MVRLNCVRGLATASALFGTASMAAAQEAPLYYNAPGVPEATPYSTAVVANGVIYLSGGLGIAPGEGSLVSGGIGPETEQVFRNFALTLEDLGASLSDVIQCNVFLADMAEYGEMNTVYSSVFPGNKPARSTVGVASLPRGAAVEIDCLALMPK